MKLFIFIVMLSPFFSQAQTSAADTVVATVNGEQIFKSELDEVLERGQLTKEEALESLILGLVTVQEAKSVGIPSRPSVLKELKESAHNIFIRTLYKDVRSSIVVTEREIRDLYNELMIKPHPKEYNARHILVKTELEAKGIIKKLDEGADFSKLAIKHSTGPSGPNGGSLGWFRLSQMVPNFAKGVELLSKGEYSKQPVKTQFGFHIIKIEDERAEKPVKLEDVREQLELSIRNKKQIAYFDELRKKADVEINLP